MTPGSLKNTALVLARLSPSTVSSVVAPRGTPRGETELMVGGVVRLPVGESVVVLAAKAATEKAKISKRFIFLPREWRGLEPRAGWEPAPHRYIS